MLLASGCALLSKAEPSLVRYFDLDRAGKPTQGTSDRREGTAASRVSLRLGPVIGAVHLEERLVYRLSQQEIAFHRDWRWTSPPHHYLKLQLARTLFEERGLRHVVGGTGPTLDVQLLDFDEIRTPEHVARARCLARLMLAHEVVLEVTLVVERPIPSSKHADMPDAIVEALSEVMRLMVTAVADEVTKKLLQGRPID